MPDFSTMAAQMQNIASPGKMPPPTMQGRGPITPPGALPPPGPGQGPPGPAGGDDQGLMQIIQQIAQAIEQKTGKPATPEQIQSVLAPMMGQGGQPGAAPGAPPPGGQQAVPPQMAMANVPQQQQPQQPPQQQRPGY